MQIEKISGSFYNEISDILKKARNHAKYKIDTIMVHTYYQMGQKIIEEEQRGAERAEYGKSILQGLSKYLTKEIGKGFSKRNLELIRKFYILYSKNQKTKSLIAESENPFNLSWTHYVRLIRIDKVEEREFYEIESRKENWSVRELDRQINSALYERLVLSRDKRKIIELSKNGQIISKSKDLIKDPYVLEFLGLEEDSSYSENDLETAIINHIEKFILELGKGFLFSGRQVRFTFDEDNYFVDLVFYNRLLRCFVLIDLKIGKLKHQDLGQMQMYVNYYDRFVKSEEEGKTIGIIICKDKQDSLVEITLPKDNKNIYASKYELYLPSKEELKKIIEEENKIIENKKNL